MQERNVHIWAHMYTYMHVSRHTSTGHSGPTPFEFLLQNDSFEKVQPQQPLLVLMGGVYVVCECLLPVCMCMFGRAF